MNKPYGTLCSLFYDATKKYAPDREVDFYARFMQPEGRVLEAMSGSGRLQIPLMQRGYTVDGVDNSASMLDRCRARCRELGLSPEIYEQPLEELALPHVYTTVTIAVGSFQLITDRAQALQALKSIRAHLMDGGDLLIDIFVPDFHGDVRSERIARIDDRTVIRLTTRYIFFPQEKLADAYCLYERVVNGTVHEQQDELLQVTWYQDDELTDLLSTAGFDTIAFYDETFRSSGPSRIVHARARVQY